MPRRPDPKQPELKNLIDIKEWQRIQDNFANITGVSLRTIDNNGRLITQPSRELRLCSELLKASPYKERVCGPCLPTFLGGTEIVDKNLSYVCQSELYNFLAPIRLKDAALGYFIVGPVILVKRKAKGEYILAAEELGLELDAFWDALVEIKELSFQSAQSIVEFIRDIGEHTAKLAYASVIKTKERRRMRQSARRLNRLLDELLGVAFQVSGAEIGSIMVLNRNRKTLSIKISKGIASDIASSAAVRLGDGISGMAAKEGRAILIDDNIEDNRIKRYLSRPYISSSMILPIKIEDRVFGVMNLGALRTSPIRFNADNVQLINRLINLATVALQQ